MFQVQWQKESEILPITVLLNSRINPQRIYLDQQVILTVVLIRCISVHVQLFISICMYACFFLASAFVCVCVCELWHSSQC